MKNDSLYAQKHNHIFVIQRHNATHIHYDLRIEYNNELISWALPKGPPLKAGVKRLAIKTESHPFAYATFEGIIPEGPAVRPREGAPVATPLLWSELSRVKKSDQFTITTLHNRLKKQGDPWKLYKKAARILPHF